MGSGSSARAQQAGPAKVAPSDGVLEDSLSRMREDIRWMQKAVEAEKSEKEWLMQRYEKMEKESMERAREVTQLRQQLAELNLAQAKAAQVTAPAKPLQQSSSEVTVTPTVTSSPSQSGVSSPTRGSLRERRSLALSVVTAKPAEDATPKDAAPKDSPPQPAALTAVTPIRDEAPVVESKKELFLQSLNSDPSRLIEPMTDKSYRSRTWGQRCTEPVSPLLSRRMDWDVGPKNVRNQGLNVSPAKVLAMGELVPASPKFAKKRTQNWSTPTCEPIAEG